MDEGLTNSMESWLFTEMANFVIPGETPKTYTKLEVFTFFTVYNLVFRWPNLFFNGFGGPWIPI